MDAGCEGHERRKQTRDFLGLEREEGRVDPVDCQCDVVLLRCAKHVSTPFRIAHHLTLTSQARIVLRKAVSRSSVGATWSASTARERTSERREDARVASGLAGALEVAVQDKVNGRSEARLSLPVKRVNM